MDENLKEDLQAEIDKQTKHYVWFIRVVYGAKVLLAIPTISAAWDGNWLQAIFWFMLLKWI